MSAIYVGPSHPIAAEPSQSGVGVRLRSHENLFYANLCVKSRPTLYQTERRFYLLAKRWTRTREDGYEIHLTTDDPSYRAIIRMGSSAVPYLLREVQRDPLLWVSALQEIVGFSPVKPGNVGYLRRMASDWLEWGREEGYLA